LVGRYITPILFIASPMSENPDSIMAALTEVAATRARAPRFSDGIVRLVLDVNGMSAEARAELEEGVRRRLMSLDGVEEVRIVMTADKVERVIIAVGSGKGGVGKSTLAANLAVALARSGKKVGLVDADIYGPSQPRIMGNQERPELSGKQIVPLEAYGVMMLSIGQMVEAGTALAWRGPMAASALGQLMDGDWGDRELLIVDLPPGTGDIQMSLMQKWKPAGAVIVSTPQDLALIDATRAIDMFRKMGVPVIGLIENMSGYACPSCGEISDPFGTGGAEAAAMMMEIPFLGRVPLRLSIREGSDAGTPPAAGTGEEAQLFAAIADRLLEQVNRSRA
jgi:ATP-binding protein involved in chromosome partitioning